MPGASIVLRVDADGTLACVYDDAHQGVLAALGTVRIARASHVEPNPTGPGWIADMAPSGGPVLGPFPLRGDALAAELAWLRAHRSL